MTSLAAAGEGAGADDEEEGADEEEGDAEDGGLRARLTAKKRSAQALLQRLRLADEQTAGSALLQAAANRADSAQSAPGPVASSVSALS